jgi:hypothetical protein
VYGTRNTFPKKLQTSSPLLCSGLLRPLLARKFSALFDKGKVNLRKEIKGVERSIKLKIDYVSHYNRTEIIILTRAEAMVVLPFDINSTVGSLFGVTILAALQTGTVVLSNGWFIMAS